MADSLPKTSLLEAGNLPFGDLVKFAVREGHRPRPIYQMHKWFARRLGCSFRAILVGAVEPATADFWKAYYESANLYGLTVLDPFVGGGTSVVEATRLGANAIGIDVDPIACAVTNAELAASRFEDLTPTLQLLQDSVGQSMASFYPDRLEGEVRLMPVHHFWVQQVQCPACRRSGEAHPNYLLSEEAGRQRWAFCRSCHEPHSLKARQGRFTCRSCDDMTDLKSPPVQSGTYTCPHCDTATPLIEIGRATEEPPRWTLFALEVTDRASQRANMADRRFVRATAADKAAATRAGTELRREIQADPNFLPGHRIVSVNRSDTRLTDYGYRNWTDLFNDRQLLHLGRLARAIKQLPDEQRRAMGLAFSNHLTTNCMLTAYAAGWRRLTPLFSIRAFRHVPRPVEINPWLDGIGRGTFPNAVRQINRAVEYAKAPREPGRRGGFRDVAPVSPTEGPRIFNGNARNLEQLSSESIDIVLTDPPYFDNVAYSELSDFFQPWLESLQLVPKTKVRAASVQQSLRANRKREETIDEFAEGLGDAFAEVCRVLKPKGLLAFTFRHSTAGGWLSMAKALARSGLKPVQVLPIPGEAGTGLHNHDGTSLWDAVLVFRKLPAARPSKALSRRQIAAARKNAQAWRDRFRRQYRLPFNGSDHLNLLRASLVAASLGFFGKADSASIDLHSALETAGSDDEGNSHATTRKKRDR